MIAAPVLLLTLGIIANMSGTPESKAAARIWAESLAHRAAALAILLWLLLAACVMKR